VRQNFVSKSVSYSFENTKINEFVTNTLDNLAMAKKTSILKFSTKYLLAKTAKTLRTTGLIGDATCGLSPKGFCDQTGINKTHYNDAIASGNAQVRTLSKNIIKKYVAKFDKRLYKGKHLEVRLPEGKN
jgi:hypothetical protein